MHGLEDDQKWRSHHLERKLGTNSKSDSWQMQHKQMFKRMRLCYYIEWVTSDASERNGKVVKRVV